MSTSPSNPIPRIVTCLALLAPLAAPAPAQEPIFLGEPVTVGPVPQRITLADVNGDGADDLLVPNEGSTTISVLLARAVGGFLPPKTFGVGLTPESIAAGDLNGDGRIDLAIANYTSASVSILIGNGLGSFAAAAPVPLAPATKVTDAVLADLDHDGKLDLAVTTQLPKQVAVFRGNGDGTFAFLAGHPVGATTTAFPIRSFAAKLNGDAHVDLLVLNFGGPVTVLLGNGAGGFAAGNDLVAGTGTAFAVALPDWNKDGKLDLLSTDGYANLLYLQLGVGDGTFGAPVNVGVGGYPISVVAGDADGDGNPDAMTANAADQTITLVLGNGASGLAPVPPFTVGASPRHLAFGHLNHDALGDLAVCFPFTNQVAAGFGAHGGYFGANPDIATYPSARAIATDDLDGNGLLDLVAVDETGGKVVFHLASTAASTPTGDAIQYAAAAAFAAGAQPKDVEIADFDGDDRPDFVTADAGSNTLTTILLALPAVKATYTAATAAAGPQALAAGDFDGDGDVDVAVGFAASPTARVFANDGLGHFALQSQANVGSPTPFLRPVDFDFDGAVDLIGITDPPRVFTLRNVGMAWSMNATGSIQGTPVGLELASLDGDAAVDVVTAIAGTGSFDGEAFLGSLSGGYSLGSGAPFSTIGDPTGLAAGDFDRDGRGDVLLLRGAGTMRAWLGDGAGAFPSSVEAWVWKNGDSLAPADLNGDGFLDVAIAHSDGVLTAALNQRLQPAGIGTFAASDRGCHGILGIGGTVAPKVGEASFTITCTQAPPVSLGLLLLADKALAPSQDLFNVGIGIHLDVFASTTLYGWNFYSDWSGYATLAAPIPNQPLLAGSSFYAEAIFAWSCATSSPFGLSSSNALSILIQP